jgi:hypothetical protein
MSQPGSFVILIISCFGFRTLSSLDRRFALGPLGAEAGVGVPGAQ